VPIGSTNDINHYGVVMEDGIRADGVRMYPSLEEWLAVLPGSPDQSMLQIDTNLAEEEQKQEDMRVTHATQAVLKKKTKWNVPPLRGMCRSLPWARHIYTLIRECDKELLQREDMRDAYNHLVDVLTTYANVIRTSVPLTFRRYRYGVTFSPDIHAPFDGIQEYVHPNPIAPPSAFEDALHTIHAAYQPLYALLHDTVVPFMERITREKRVARDRIVYTRCRDRYVKQMMRLTEQYEKKATYLRSQMERYQFYLNELE
jgi:hypothetical protein